ncbi:MAG: Na+/H+ antiporter subunit E [Bacillota bacterium]|nr:Na+/H+ antiporter subunit E [Bacillota bacterium]
MRRFRNNYKLFIILMGFWLLLNMSLRPLNLIAGALICLFVTKFSEGILYNHRGFVFKAIDVKVLMPYTFNLFKEIYISSFSYIKRIIKKDCQPFITEIELKVKDPLIIAIIANSITLTPGTITVNADGNKLTVLSLKDCKEGPETVRKEIRENFERFFI